MTTQGKLNGLLRFFDTGVTAREMPQGSKLKLCAQDIEILRVRYGFLNEHELVFYIMGLESEGLVISHFLEQCTVPSVSITIDGYRWLDSIKGNPS